VKKVGTQYIENDNSNNLLLIKNTDRAVLTGWFIWERFFAPIFEQADTSECRDRIAQQFMDVFEELGLIRFIHQTKTSQLVVNKVLKTPYHLENTSIVRHTGLCEWCWEPIPGDKPKTYRYCCPQHQADAKKARKTILKGKPFPLQCKNCGDALPRKYPNRRYCSDGCRTQYNRKKNKS
jgi:hypothetical protein